eukprot:TRINITY_DN403_c0_g1_i1.p1 TRINITY_DN403_c0_g1~~TRINITY_DN403_c0_g1_i1.p1  ORF type:complete len:409 (+),score=97.02 TRINITY_DN403_c0_g1_i1:61-1287(+)
MSSNNIDVIVEIIISDQFQDDNDTLKENVEAYIKNNYITLKTVEINIDDIDSSNIYLKENVQNIVINCNNLDSILFWNANIEYLIYQLHDQEPLKEYIDEKNQITTSWILPNRHFLNLWDSLIFDSNIKHNLISYCQTSLLFAKKSIDSNLVNWNKVILLHGPPGTGKTSLCRSLSQRISVLLSKEYSYGQLIEVNTHSLFSKFFSESGKLVSQLFNHVEEIADDQDCLVFVLIDEVESLSASRQRLSSSEPGDALRVVNALLTRIDQLKRLSNVLILTTSNLSETLDLAFVDRADLRTYVGFPSVKACEKILSSSSEVLIKAGILQPFDENLYLTETDNKLSQSNHLSLAEISKLASERKFSGRRLRKLPFLAHALYLKKNSYSYSEWLSGLKNVILNEEDSFGENV